MAIFTRRNAFVGWIVLKNRKRLAKEMVRTVPAPGPRIAAIVAGVVAGIAGVLLFWRSQRGGEAE
jgi:hypothetical protein